MDHLIKALKEIFNLALNKKTHLFFAYYSIFSVRFILNQFLYILWGKKIKIYDTYDIKMEVL